MRKNAFVAREHIADFNEVRIILTSLKAPFPEELLREHLKEHNLVSNPLFIGELRRAGILKVENRRLLFVDRKPVHYNKLQEVYSKYQKRVNEYSKRARDKKSLQRLEENRKVQFAIDFLKSMGYEVLAPVGSLYTKI